MKNANLTTKYTLLVMNSKAVDSHKLTDNNSKRK